MDHLVIAQKHGPLNAVLQLPNVAGPVVCHQHVNGGRGDADDVLVVLPGVALHEIVGQEQNVGAPLPQRRDVDGEDVQPVIQVLPELLRLDELFQVPVGGGNHAHIRRNGERAAHALELALLQDPEELDLHGPRQVSNLVQEKGAALGKLEPAFPRCNGARESALLMTEQLALDHPFGQRGAVHLHERPGRAPVGVMDGVGHLAPFPCRFHRAAAPWCRLPRPAR